MGIFLIVDLDSTASAVEMVGAKAAALGQLCRAGLPVPNGFALSADASEAYLGNAGLSEAVERLYAAVESGAADWRRQAIALRARLASAPVPDEVIDALRNATQKLRPPLAVRSSALVEDNPGASFAGLFNTIVGVTDFGDVLAAVRSCWASRFSDTVIRYAVGRGVDPRRTKIAVIVQQAIDARSAGSALSHDARRGLSITGAWGLGRAVAEGQVTPDWWRLDREHFRIAERKVGTKTFAARLNPGGGEVWWRVSDGRAARPCMADHAVERLGCLVLQAERVFGCAQSVEWAMDRHQRLWLLQSRPLIVNARPPETVDALPGTVSLLDGQPASPGRVVGPARRLGPNGVPVGPGDVLVARSLPAGLAAVLPQVAGLVLESAGSTAHAATLVRERGIPAVFGVAGASRAMPEGSLVCVDGTAGRVEYHPVL